jgi:hypothetical protein
MTYLERLKALEKQVAKLQRTFCCTKNGYPETWDGIANATNCGYYETYLNTNYPSDLKVKVLTSESTFDGTGFHYNGAANEIIANKIITLLNGVL